MIDAHHHIWLRKDLPWLHGPERPRIFGPHAPLRRDYPIEEFLADLEGSGVGKSVHVQANWAPERGADEAAWVQSVADETGWPHAIVAHADMTAPNVRPALDRLSRHPLVRGIRQQFHWHANPRFRFAARADLCRDATVRRNIAHLAEYGWPFDLQVFPEQMPDAADLARACPDVVFVLEHAGMPEDASPAGRAEWRNGLRALAERRNVVAKLSGLGTFIRRNDPVHVAGVTEETVEIFGAERCMFGSNFPIEKLWTTYADLVAAFRTATARLPAEARDAIFENTAARVYGLN